MNKFELKFRKILSWKVFWDFLSFFKWDWIEFDDFRQYVPWDDIRAINWKLSWKYDELFVNLFKQQKDADIYIFFDINKNWLGHNWNYYVKDKIFEMFSELVLFAKKYKANIIWTYNEKDKIKHYYIWKNFQNAYSFIKRTEKQLNNRSFYYYSWLSNFLDHQKKITKKRIIVIFSDFLAISEYEKKLIKQLQKHNEVLLFRFDLSDYQWINYNKFTFNCSDIKKEKIFYKI